MMQSLQLMARATVQLFPSAWGEPLSRVLLRPARPAPVCWRLILAARRMWWLMARAGCWSTASAQCGASWRNSWPIPRSVSNYARAHTQ